MEIADFILDIKSGRAPQPGLSDGQSALRIVEQLYSGTKAMIITRSPFVFLSEAAGRISLLIIESTRWFCDIGRDRQIRLHRASSDVFWRT
jgi:hypothetical protein